MNQDLKLILNEMAMYVAQYGEPILDCKYSAWGAQFLQFRKGKKGEVGGVYLFVLTDAMEN